MYRKCKSPIHNYISLKMLPALVDRLGPYFFTDSKVLTVRFWSCCIFDSLNRERISYKVRDFEGQSLKKITVLPKDFTRLKNYLDRIEKCRIVTRNVFRIIKIALRRFVSENWLLDSFKKRTATAMPSLNNLCLNNIDCELILESFFAALTNSVSLPRLLRSTERFSNFWMLF